MKKHSKSSIDHIAVIAGGGTFPSLIISHLKQTKKNFVVLYLKNNVSPKVAKGIKHISVALGEIGKALTFFKQNQVKEIVFVGKVQRPSLFSMKLDLQGFSLLGKMGMETLKGGDDKILSYIIKVLEKQGFKIIAPETLLPRLITPSGVLGKIKPTKQDYKDISIGKKVLTMLGNSDMGQAIIVENEYILGIEAAEGTDNLILRCGKLKKKAKLGYYLK